jgi:hypothetical protein
VLERLPGAEVSGKGENPDQLGRADRLLDLVCRRRAGFGLRAVHLESLATDLAAGHQATDRVKKLGGSKVSGQHHHFEKVESSPAVCGGSWRFVTILHNHAKSPINTGIWLSGRDAGGGTRTPDTRIMMAGLEAELPAAMRG